MEEKLKELPLHFLLEKMVQKGIEHKEGNTNSYGESLKCFFEVKDRFEKLEKENERYKDINQGLLEVQFSLRDKEKEYKQWFEVASQNVKEKEKTVEQVYQILSCGDYDEQAKLDNLNSLLFNE